jgi:two-component system phosphate regulon sensor histidine kinase PhoR
MDLRSRLQLHSVAVVAIVVTFVLIFDEGATLGELILPAFGAAVVAVLLATVMSAPVSRSVADMTEVVRSLARGDTSQRAPLTAPGELEELSVTLGKLSDVIATRITAMKNSEALEHRLVEALDEGVVIVDPRRHVVRMNAAARAIMGYTGAVPFAFDLLPRSLQLRQALESAIAGSDTGPIEADIAGHTVSLVAKPLPTGGGVVLALFDLTRIRKLENVRRDFVANVSHELRTPLTVITGFAETLADDDVPPAMRQQFAETIRTHADRMRHIVDELLDLSRLESGNWSPQPEDVAVTEVAEEILATYHDAASVKGITLDADIAEGAGTVRADRTAIRQVLSNLVDNALRYTDEGTVVLFAERVNGGVRVGVRDTGLGIPPTHLPRIFERFYRVDSGRARQTGGTGLGLAIVKHLVESHGGRVEAESQPGRGSTIAAVMPD